VNETLSHWRVVDRCDDAHTTVNGEVTETLTQCDAGRAIELIVIADAGHQWPEGKPHMRSKMLHLDQPSKHLDATTQLWEFFAAHPVPEPPAG
jgi:polyhydroxybutyrate depolymerase